MIDEDQDGLINFKEFSQLCGTLCRGEFYERMKLLYRMHLSPKDTGGPGVYLEHQKDQFDVVENAAEATEESDDEFSSEDTLLVVPSDMGVQGLLENEGEIVLTPNSSSFSFDDMMAAQSGSQMKVVASQRAVASSTPQKMVASSTPQKMVDSSTPQRVPTQIELAATLDAVDQLQITDPEDDARTSEQTPSMPVPATSSPDFAARPLSPNTSEYILSKSPKSAKKLVKDFVASVMKEGSGNRPDDLPDMSQVRLSLLPSVKVVLVEKLIARA